LGVIQTSSWKLTDFSILGLATEQFQHLGTVELDHLKKWKFNIFWISNDGWGKTT
jgi:hypothetical protein